MKFKRVLMAGIVAATFGSMLTGCSSIGVGEEEFACTGMPGSVYCHSARDVYEKTNDGVVPSPVGKKDGAYNEECEDCVRAEDVNPELTVSEDENSRYAVGVGRGKPSAGKTNDEFIDVVDKKTGERKTIRRKTLEVNDDEIINNYVAPRLPSEPVPIRTPSQVMRIWVAPYVDTNGDLVAPGFVYTEIEPRRWIYPGDEYGGNAKMLSPLQATKVYPASASKAPKKDAYNSLEKLKRDQMRNQ